MRRIKILAGLSDAQLEHLTDFMELKHVPQWSLGFAADQPNPVRGRFSRSEQLRQALAANPEARYSMEELSIAQAFEDLPTDMKRRLETGERTGE